MTGQDKPTVGAAPHASDGSDSGLRDARLAQALRHMPDAHMQPGAQARLAVLQHAQAAVADRSDNATPKARRWRQWLLGTSGQRRSSHAAWGGALASVLVASFITLMWYDQPVPDASPDLPAATGPADSAAPASPPAPAAAEAKRAEAPVTALLKQESLKETRKPAAPKAAEAPPPPFIPPPEVQAAAAPPPAPAPAPAAIAPPPVVSVQQAVPTGGLFADAVPAAPAARARADMPQARMAAAPAPLTMARSEFIDIQSDGPTSRTVRRVPASQAEALLAYLRDLREQHSARGPSPQATGAAAEQRAVSASDMQAPPITIRTPQGERWEIWPTQMRVQEAQFFAISPTQYESLRSLVEQATAP